MTIQIRGAYTALITPFRDGAVDHSALRELVERQISGGINGLVPCGTTGEAATMTEDEQIEVIRTVVETARGRLPVIAGTGSNDTARTVRYTKRVAALGGVDAALVVTPYYNKPGQDAMVRHYQEVADEGGLPVVVYNVPGRTAVSLSVDTIARLATHRNIIAIKEATGDMILATRIRETCGDGIALLSGDDFTTFPLLAVGGVGCISVVSNLDPAALSQMCSAALGGDWLRARELHYKIQPLARALFSDANPVPVKACASLLGWCTPELRAPLYPPEDAACQKLQQALDAYGLKR